MFSKIKQHFTGVLQIKTSSREIALGFAVGTFFAILPTPGLSVLLGLIALLIYKKMSKIALFAAMIIFNPLVVMPFHILAFHIGNTLLGLLPVETINITIFDHFWIYTRRFLLGSLIVASTTSTISYFILHVVLRKRNNQ